MRSTATFIPADAKALADGLSECADSRQHLGWAGTARPRIAPPSPLEGGGRALPTPFGASGMGAPEAWSPGAAPGDSGRRCFCVTREAVGGVDGHFSGSARPFGMMDGVFAEIRIGTSARAPFRRGATFAGACGAANPSATRSASRHCLPVGWRRRHSLAVENIAKATVTVSPLIP